MSKCKAVGTLIVLAVVVGWVMGGWNWDGAQAAELGWVAFLGGGGDDGCQGTCVDRDGSIYIAGGTNSADLSLPNGHCTSYGGGGDAYLIKLNPSGTTILWGTYFGGSKSDTIAGIALDSQGNILATGNTTSDNFAATSGLIPKHASSDGFVAKFTSEGQLLWSTCLGGSSGDYSNAIAIDATDNVFVSGYTNSSDFSSPGAPPPRSGSSDAFVAKIDPEGRLVWSKLIGGASSDSLYGIGCGSDGSIAITGHTSSTDFPVLNAYRATLHGSGDAFVAKLSSSGDMQWATYLGDNDGDSGKRIAIVPDGTVVLAISSYDSFDKIQIGLARFSASGRLSWIKHYGGFRDDSPSGLALDPAGNIYMVGSTLSDDFPVPDAFQKTKRGDYDCFLLRLSPEGTIVWGSYLGGHGVDGSRDVSIDSSGSLFVVGTTKSREFSATDHSTRTTVDIFVAQVLPGFMLTVKSTPRPDAPITGDKPGTADYSSYCAPSEVVSLNAPTTYTRDGVQHTFIHWLLDGAVQLEGQARITLTMNGRHAITAEFTNPRPILAVQSTTPGVEITGDRPGLTNYSVTCTNGDSIVLEAPKAATIGGYIHLFQVWLVDGARRLYGDRALTVAMDADHTATAVYDPAYYDLDVSSTPCSASFSGPPYGVTPYTARCRGGQSVTLTAPERSSYVFICWKIDGSPELEGQRTLQLTMTAPHAVEALYSTLRTLSVKSLPLGGAEISGSKPGKTNYTANCADGEIVSLSAPPTAIMDGVPCAFVRWSIDTKPQPDGQRNISVAMDANHAVEAKYAGPDTTLTVTSSPILGISIAGTKSGTTRYAAPCSSFQSISLTAPLYCSADGLNYRFDQWVVDGLAQTQGRRDLSTAMSKDRLVEAQYVIDEYLLTVESSPVTGVTISGSTGGVTNYSAALPAKASAALVAPLMVTVEGRKYAFLRWELNGANMGGNPEVSVLLNGNRKVVAVYSDTFKLTVKSSPVSGIPIAGDLPGTTDYTVSCTAGQTVTLSAPPTISVDGIIKHFACWKIGDKAMSAVPILSVTMSMDRSVLAVYTEAKLTVKGPVERGEDPLPAGGGEFTLDLYLSNTGLTYRLNTGFTFLDQAGEGTQFLVAEQGNSMELRINTEVFSYPYNFSSRDVPVEGPHLSFLSVGSDQSVDITDETWVLSATYEYGPAAAGTYCTSTDSYLREIGSHDPALAVIPGHLTIALAGDVNGDCRVNILDLILVRNNIGKGSGSKADVNGDGKVGVADLVLVRERLGTRCP